MTIQLCTQLKQLWKLSLKKITGLNLDTAITCAVLSPVNYPSQLADGHLWVRIILVSDEYIDMNMFKTFVLWLMHFMRMTIAVMYAA